jgi:peptidoglycan biosynthesis protein MviN/MurJ (putative lipid II flippase)
VRSRRGNTRTALVFGIVFTLLSAATAVWHPSRGEPATVALALLAGGLIVLAFGLYLELRPGGS